MSKPKFGEPSLENVFLINYGGSSYYLIIGAPDNGLVSGLGGNYIHRHGEIGKYLSGVLPISGWNFRDLKIKDLPITIDKLNKFEIYLAPHNIAEINKYYIGYKRAYNKAMKLLPQAIRTLRFNSLLKEIGKTL